MVNLRSASPSDDSHVSVIISHVPVEGTLRYGKFTFFTADFCANAGFFCMCFMQISQKTAVSIACKVKFFLSVSTVIDSEWALG